MAKSKTKPVASPHCIKVRPGTYSGIKAIGYERRMPYIDVIDALLAAWEALPESRRIAATKRPAADQSPATA